MERCTRTTELEVRHIRKDGGNGLDNATVLCHHCYAALDLPTGSGPEPPPFDEETKRKAIERAEGRCQCESSGGCH